MTNASTSTSTIIRRARVVPAHTFGGLGGLVFIATVAVQNGIRLSAPADDASTAAVIHFYATTRTSTTVLAALFPIGATGLAVFVGALGSRLSSSGARASAFAGLLGAAGIFASYSMLMATDIALSAYVDRGAAEPGVVSALWVTHDTVFAVLLVAIAVDLAGLSVSAASAGFLARPWKQVGVLGALALAATGAAAPMLVQGSRIIGLGLAGFLTWLAFVGTCSVAMLRSPD